MRNYYWFFMGCFLLGFGLCADNTELQTLVLKIGETSELERRLANFQFDGSFEQLFASVEESTIENETAKLISDENFDRNRNELLGTLTDNLAEFISNRYPFAYENPVQLASIQVAHYVIFFLAAGDAAARAAGDAAWVTTGSAATRNATRNAARNAAWVIAGNAAGRNSALDVVTQNYKLVWAKNVAENAAEKAATRNVSNAFSDKNITGPQKKGETAWRLAELYVLALVGQPEGDFINKHFVNAYNAAFGILERDSYFKNMHTTTDIILDQLATYTWGKQPKENEAPLRENPFIISMAKILGLNLNPPTILSAQSVIDKSGA